MPDGSSSQSAANAELQLETGRIYQFPKTNVKLAGAWTVQSTNTAEGTVTLWRDGAPAPLVYSTQDLLKQAKPRNYVPPAPHRPEIILGSKGRYILDFYDANKQSYSVKLPDGRISSIQADIIDAMTRSELGAEKKFLAYFESTREKDAETSEEEEAKKKQGAQAVNTVNLAPDAEAEAAKDKAEKETAEQQDRRRKEERDAEEATAQTKEPTLSKADLQALRDEAKEREQATRERVQTLQAEEKAIEIELAQLQAELRERPDPTTEIKLTNALNQYAQVQSERQTREQDLTKHTKDIRALDAERRRAFEEKRQGEAQLPSEEVEGAEQIDTVEPTTQAHSEVQALVQEKREQARLKNEYWQSRRHVEALSSEAATLSSRPVEQLPPQQQARLQEIQLELPQAQRTFQSATVALNGSTQQVASHTQSALGDGELSITLSSETPASSRVTAPVSLSAAIPSSISSPSSRTVGGSIAGGTVAASMGAALAAGTNTSQMLTLMRQTQQTEFQANNRIQLPATQIATPNTQLENEIQQLQSKIEAAKQQIRQLSQERAGLNTEITQLQQQLSTGARNAPTARDVGTNARINQLQRRLPDLDREIQTVEMGVLDQEKQLDRIQIPNESLTPDADIALRGLLANGLGATIPTTSPSSTGLPSYQRPSGGSRINLPRGIASGDNDEQRIRSAMRSKPLSLALDSKQNQAQNNRNQGRDDSQVSDSYTEGLSTTGGSAGPNAFDLATIRQNNPTQADRDEEEAEGDESATISSSQRDRRYNQRGKKAGLAQSLFLGGSMAVGGAQGQPTSQYEQGAQYEQQGEFSRTPNRQLPSEQEADQLSNLDALRDRDQQRQQPALEQAQQAADRLGKPKKKPLDKSWNFEKARGYIEDMRSAAMSEDVVDGIKLVTKLNIQLVMSTLWEAPILAVVANSLSFKADKVTNVTDQDIQDLKLGRFGQAAVGMIDLGMIMSCIMANVSIILVVGASVLLIIAFSNAVPDISAFFGM